jgi:hypothetical protein
MINISVVDLAVIAGQTLGIASEAALKQMNLLAAQNALAEADRGAAVIADQDGAARAGIALMHALLRHRPFPAGGDRIAVAAGLQFLSLNGWRAELDLPGTAAVVIEALASRQLSPAAAAAWLSPRLMSDKSLRPTLGAARGFQPGQRVPAAPKPASVVYPQVLLFIQAGGWAAATLLLYEATSEATAAGGSGLQELAGLALVVVTGSLATGKALLGARINRTRSPRTRRLVIITEIAMTCFGLLWLLIPAWGAGLGWVAPGVAGALLSLVAVVCMTRPGARHYFGLPDGSPGSWHDSRDGEDDGEQTTLCPRSAATDRANWRRCRDCGPLAGPYSANDLISAAHHYGEPAHRQMGQP